MSSAPVDPGLQVERTALAWRRTGIAVLVGSLIGLRVLAPQLGWGSVVCGVAGSALAAILLWASARRHRRVHAALTDAGSGELPGELPGGALLVVVAAAAVLLGALALTYLVLRST
jgi:putative membrane protein